MPDTTPKISDLDVFRHAGPPGPGYPQDMRTLYSPIDDVHGALKTVLGWARQSIVLAMFGYDDDELAALIAHALDDKSMFVQVTLDSSQAGGVHEAKLLATYKHEMTGNSVAIGRSEKGAIMHRKMVIVDGRWVIGGSTNWSTSGESLQDNELRITDSADAAAEARKVLDIEHDSALAAMLKKAPAA